MCALKVRIFHFNDTFTGSMNWCCGMLNTCHNEISCHEAMNKLCPSTLAGLCPVRIHLNTKFSINIL